MKGIVNYRRKLSRVNIHCMRNWMKNSGMGRIEKLMESVFWIIVLYMDMDTRI